MTPPTPRFWEDAETLLADHIPGYRPRAQQTELATLMRTAAGKRQHTAIEARTGTGKSWAALIVADNLTGRTIISTATRALQHQYSTDIPKLRAIGLLKQDTVVLDGRRNTICPQRLHTEIGITTGKGKLTLKKILKELDGDENHNGSRDTFRAGAPDWLWARICSDTDACRAAGCTPSNCPYATLRARARNAGTVIVNHHILLADAMIKGGSAIAWGRRSPTPDEKEKPAILGPYRHLIIDEAHALEAAAESFGERRVSVRGVQALASRIGKLPHSGAATTALAAAAAEIATTAASLPQGCLLEPVDAGPILTAAAAHAKDAARAARDAGDDETTAEILAAACNNLAARLTAIDSALRFGEDELGARAPSAEKGSIASQLVDAGPWLRDQLWDQVPTTLMSGTLTVPGKPGYVPSRIGLTTTEVTKLGSVFDLAAQRLIYITPRADTGGGARVGDADIAELLDLLDASGGRALVLFSANQDLRYTYDRIHDRAGHPVLGQGITPSEDQPRARRRTNDTATMPNSRLAELFHTDTRSILLATRSFFEGVDFPGDSCSLVVIMRYPNLRPDDPLTLARRKLIEKRGGNAWTEYQEPSMLMVFQQAAGRAIRRTDDKGVVAVLDPRSGTKQYARKALLSLVPSDFTDSLDDVKKFLT